MLVAGLLTLTACGANGPSSQQLKLACVAHEIGSRLALDGHEDADADAAGAYIVAVMFPDETEVVPGYIYKTPATDPEAKAAFGRLLKAHPGLGDAIAAC